MTKLGQNAPCHCGSGKKYKKSCYDKDQAAAHQAALVVAAAKGDDWLPPPGGGSRLADPSLTWIPPSPPPPVTPEEAALALVDEAYAARSTGKGIRLAKQALET